MKFDTLGDRCEHYEGVELGFYCWKCLQKDRRIRKEWLIQKLDFKIAKWQGSYKRDIRNVAKIIDEAFEDVMKNKERK